MELDEKKKKKPYNSMSITTGDIDYNIRQFNKRMGTAFPGNDNNNPSTEEAKANAAAEAACKATNTVIAASPDGGTSVSNSTDGGASVAGSGESAVGVGESLEINEAKRYVRRYYVKPQNIFCSNKAEVLKALIDYEDQDLTVYTLINLGDTKDVGKLTPNDVIYYYEDGILYDKNHVRIMDYDLYIKHEEERKKFASPIEQVSDAAFAAEYEDRMTDATNTKEAKESLTEGGRAKWAVKYTDLWNAVFAKPSIKNPGTINLGLDTKKDPTVRQFCNFLTNTYGDPTYNKYLSGNEARQQAKDVAVKIIKDFEAVEHLKRAFESELNLKIQLEIKNTFGKDYDSLIAQAHEELRIDRLTNSNAEVRETTRQQIQQAAFIEAMVKKYFEQKINQIHQDQKRGEFRAIDLTEAEKQKAMTWLAFHVTSIQASIPKKDSDDLSLVDGLDLPADQIEAKEEAIENAWHSEEQDYFAKFKGAIEGKDANYTYRLASKSTDPRKDLWHVSAITTFDTAVAEAPDIIKRMIDDAKRQAKRQDVLYTDDLEKDNQVNSYPFAKAIVSLFNNDANFYKNPTKYVRESVNNDNPFDQTFDDYNVYGERVECLHESKESEVCCICGEPIDDYGNNPEPYKHGGRCCDACNIKFVIPARLEKLNQEGE